MGAFAGGYVTRDCRGGKVVGQARVLWSLLVPAAHDDLYDDELFQVEASYYPSSTQLPPAARATRTIAHEADWQARHPCV